MRVAVTLFAMALCFVGGVYFGQTSTADYAGMMDRFAGTIADRLNIEGEDVAPSVTDEPATLNLLGAVLDTDGPVPRSGSFVPEMRMQVCPRMTVSNAPVHGPELWISDYFPFVDVNGVILAVAPTNGACLSSGFGWRSGRVHKGVDFRADPPGTVHAAAAGTIREAGYRDDYGNYVVLDHGDGVFTRYAHLTRLEPGIEAGADVSFGTLLGPMGNTASYPLPFHLHYEVLLGDYETQARSFGLDARNPFDFPYVRD